MATTIRPNQRPGKLSSKFGAAFAAFESNSGESNVPQAFRSASMRKKTAKPSTVGSNSASKPKETNEAKQKTRFSQGGSINSDDLSGSTGGKLEQSTQAPAAPNNGAQQETQSTLNNPTPSPVKRNFRVSSKLANRTKMFESSNNNCNKGLPTNGTTAYKNTRQGLRKVKKETSVERPTPAATESFSEPASNTESKSRNEEAELVTESTDVAAEDDDDDSECYGYVEYLVKDTAHSTLGGVYSDDEYEETWEEETLDSTEEEEDDWSWEEETIEDGVIEEEDEYSVGVQSS